MNLKQLVREALENKDCCTATKPTKAPILNENLQSRVLMTENMKYHIDNKKPLTENTFRYGSKAFLDLWAEARFLYSRGAIDVSGIDKEIITETKLGEYGMFEGQMVPLDLPMVNEINLNSAGVKDLIRRVVNDAKLLDFLNFETVKDFLAFIQHGSLDEYYEIEDEVHQYDSQLNEAEYHGKKVQIGKPKRGGASGKKFYVYVMDKGKVKKVSFGDSGGLSTKINDPKARHAYAARHKCAQAKDRTKAGYWSCNIGRYWKSLGGSKNFSGYW